MVMQARGPHSARQVTRRPPRRVEIPLLRTGGAGVVRSARAMPRGTFLATLILIFVLPFFAQVFHYLNELPPPYYLSKAWPVLMFPFGLYAILKLNLPGHNLFLVLLAYLLGFTPLISIIQLGNGLFDALTTTVKAWPFIYYFALSGVLVLLALPPERVRKVFLGFGLGTFVLFIVIWVVAPASWYVTNPEDGKLLQYDVDRGHRVYMSTFFGMIFIFYMGRSFIETRKLIYAVAIPVALLILLLIYKQRTAIAAAFLITCYGMVMSLPPRQRRLAAGIGVLVAVPLVALGAWQAGLFTPTGWEKVGAIFGGSLSVRQNSAGLAAGYLGDHTLRWMFGVGATTRFGAVTLADIFGYDQFFIADLGWLGVVFEYGVIGAMLILAVHVWSFFTITRNGMVEKDRFQLVLGDYVLYLLLTSSVYSLVFLPGELGVVLALAMYLHQCRAKAGGDMMVASSRGRRWLPRFSKRGQHAQAD